MHPGIALLELRLLIIEYLTAATDLLIRCLRFLIRVLEYLRKRFQNAQRFIEAERKRRRRMAVAVGIVKTAELIQQCCREQRIDARKRARQARKACF
ncbi:hypothetical protein CRV162 [Nile crocodilepox virus]|uniref:Uncharacterized protein n=1 Tax=Nile crocodilepox virus (isolate Crocodylus niloticus/Zimbabwe/Ume/2001) TaxID=1289473 RepID=Q06ZY9_CPRVZ|nr:hypothetical protein CRV162 [Nile crocodilepox virus]ABJ09053.1 hypothetical protein CRV162 [Nile crocodilepox virus]